MILNLLNKNMVKILLYLAISPGSRYERKELKEKTQMNNVPLDETINKLISLKIIKQEKSLYSLNLELEQTKNIIELTKKEYNKFNLTYKIFIILLEISEKLSKIKNIESVILFGSYAKLIHTEKSDIDLAIILSDKIKDTKIENKTKKELEKISKKSKKIIEPHFFAKKEIKNNKSDPLIKEILKNGKPLF
jgi:predicted nucleotidyltransferase